MRYSRCGKEVADEKKLCPGRKRKRAAIWGAAGEILVLLLTVAAGSEEPQRVKMDKEEESAAKERRLIRKTEYSEDGTFRAETIYEYDEMGRKKKAVRYEADGTVVGWGSTDYEYDEAGNMIREVRSDYDCRCEYSESGQLLRETGFMFGVDFYDYRYDYNEAGRIVREAHYQEDGSVSFCEEYQYGRAGALAERLLFYDGAFFSRTRYIYDDYGKLMTEISERSGETVYSHVEYEYDSGGRLLRKTNYIYGDDSRETVGWHYEYSYDSSDHLVSGEYYSGDGGLEERCEYFESGVLKKKYVYWNNHSEKETPVLREYYEYNGSGQMVRWADYYMSGDICNDYEYIYDNAGYLTRLNIYHPNNPQAGDSYCLYEYE